MRHSVVPVVLSTRAGHAVGRPDVKMVSMCANVGKRGVCFPLVAGRELAPQRMQKGGTGQPPADGS